MPDNKVPDADTNVRASELHDGFAGAWLKDPEAPAALVRLKYATEADAARNVILVFEQTGGFITSTVEQDRTVQVLGRDAVELAETAMARRRYLAGLHDLAEMIESTGVDVDLDDVSFDLSPAGMDKAALEAVGEKLGVEPKHDFYRGFSVLWTSPGGGVRAVWRAQYPACPHVFAAAGDLPEESCKLYDGHEGDHARPYRVPKPKAAVKP